MDFLKRLFGGEDDLEAVGRGQQQLGTQQFAVAPAQLLAVAEALVVAIAAVLVNEPQGGNVAKRNVERAHQADRFTAADFGGDEAAGFAKPRIDRLHQHGAAGGVAAEQGALRPLEGLDRFNVDRQRIVAQRVRDDLPVDINADRWIDLKRVGALHVAANGDGNADRSGRYRHDRHVGVGQGQALEAVYARTLELGAGKRGDRDRHLLQPFIALARRDDDLTLIAPGVIRFHGGCGTAGLSLDRRCRKGDRYGEDTAGNSRKTLHCALPGSGWASMFTTRAWPAPRRMNDQRRSVMKLTNSQLLVGIQDPSVTPEEVWQ
ncbi:MAG TPA: hypothetical protein PLL48_12255 [Novosphingobium sp.]|nr:hypothetical protein [Novosphingobium sp.]